MAKSSGSSKSASRRARAEARRKEARRKQIISWAVFGVGALIVGVIFVFAFSSGETATGVTETDSWDLPELDGEGRIKLEDFSGKPTVAAFFASWCTICQVELPGFGVLERQIGQEVNFVGINSMNNGSGLPFAIDRGIGAWPLARDVGGIDGRQLATNFGARGSPTTVIYDESGNVVDVTVGRLTADALATKLQEFFGITR